jgi:hypothetical protein
MVGEYITDLIQSEGIPDRRKKGGLGKYYSFELADYPFLQGRKGKGTKYVIPLTNAKGEKKYITGDTAQDVIDKFKLEHASGWNEATVGFDKLKDDMKEKKNFITTYKVENIKDMGDLPASAYPAPPKTEDSKIYVGPGPSGSGSLDWLTGIINTLRSWGIK